jgi:hypothetical protein
MLRFVAALALCTAIPIKAHAEIVVLRCGFAEMERPIFITKSDDETPSRVGIAPGVGDRAYVSIDPRSGAWTAVEINPNNLPITFTTIQPDLEAVHSRHVLWPDGTVPSPSQQRGRCERVT